MSTILHPVQNHAWWYAAAAAAVATGLLVVLVTLVFSRSGAGLVTPPPVDVIQHGQGHVYAPPCHMGRPGGSLELSRPGCPA